MTRTLNQISIEQTLRERQSNNQCAICGENITFKAEPYKDYFPIVHAIVGEVLVHSRHLK